MSEPTPIDNYSIIMAAIINKQPIKAYYQDHYREMCPHAIGVKNGKRNALFYQFGGVTSSGDIIQNSKDNWKCMEVSMLTELEIIDGPWITMPNHSQKNNCIDIYDLEVEY